MGREAFNGWWTYPIVAVQAGNDCIHNWGNVRKLINNIDIHRSGWRLVSHQLNYLGVTIMRPHEEVL